MSITLATLTTLGQLQDEMAQAGREPERSALREVLLVLHQQRHNLLTTGQAAARLGISIPTVKRWTERGALDAARVKGRWLVTTESVQRQVALREALAAVANEGFPTDAELSALFASKRDSSSG